MPITVNDNEGPRDPLRRDPDAHGQAALLLAESMLHALVEAGTLTKADAITVVETAREIKIEVAAIEHEAARTMLHSLDLLAAIGLSLKTDGSESGMTLPHGD